MVNIIIEGVDKSGKGTLIELFMKKHPEYRYFHCAAPESLSDEQKKKYYNAYYYNHLKDLENNNCIFDRFHCGELVYGKKYRNYEIDYFDDLEIEIIQKSDTILILVIAQPIVIFCRGDNKGAMFAEKDNKKLFDDIVEVSSLFLKAYQRSILRKFIIDTTHINTDECLKLIDEGIKKEYGFLLPDYCYVCGNKLLNDELVDLIDYKLKHKRCSEPSRGCSE